MATLIRDIKAAYAELPDLLQFIFAVGLISLACANVKLFVAVILIGAIAPSVVRMVKK